MIRPSLGTALAGSLLVSFAAAASAQNSTDPGTTTTAPPTGSDRPSANTTPPPASTETPARTEEPAPRTATEVVPVPVVVPQAQTQPAPAPIELQDQPYPNGFADPNAVYGNDMSVAVRQESDGFDWGLLGLLGLLGLFGLYRPRRGDYRHVVHQERYDDGRPPRV